MSRNDFCRGEKEGFTRDPALASGCTIGLDFESKKRKLPSVEFNQSRPVVVYDDEISVEGHCRVGLSIVLIVAPLPGGAVDPNQRATSYIQTVFTVEDGLSSNVVNAILVL